MKYIIYICDTETTGLDSHINDVIELSMHRVSDDVQKTWSLKPFNMDAIDPGALRVNGHKLEDLQGLTKYGRDTYSDPVKTIVDVENWIMEDGVSSDKRILCGHNVSFDRDMIKQLWKKCNSSETFPFGHRMMDTMMIEFILDYAKDDLADSYSLSALLKKHGVKNDKAHSAAGDVKATKEVFEKQLNNLKKIFNK
jgi:DNA polymerase III alpha subunit (gram-positive type)